MRASALIFSPSSPSPWTKTGPPARPPARSAQHTCARARACAHECASTCAHARAPTHKLGGELDLVPHLLAGCAQLGGLGLLHPRQPCMLCSELSVALPPFVDTVRFDMLPHCPQLLQCDTSILQTNMRRHINPCAYIKTRAPFYKPVHLSINPCAYMRTRAPIYKPARMHADPYAYL